MELDEFKTAWQSMDQKLSATMTLQRGLHREIRVDRTRRSLGRFLGLPISELIVGLATALTGGGFLIGNFNQATFAGSVAPTVVFLLGALTVVLSIWQIELITSLDYSGPVVDIQRKLAKITQIRIKSAAWLKALLTPLWAVFPVFVLQLLAGRVGYKALGAKLAELYATPWFTLNILVCATLVVVVSLAVKWKWGNVNWSKVLSETSLKNASEHLEEIAEFEKER
jgi:hypothetical protein